MGAVLSGFAAEDCGVQGGSSHLRPGPGLGDVPESCISSIFMYLEPPEICRLAGLNRTFRGASVADFVWETKLPSSYKFLVKKILGETSPVSLSKKEIYTRLCRPNYFDDDTKQVWMDKTSGKIYVSVSYKALRITGIDDRRYWNRISSEESRFHEIAYLKQTWWLEVKGELEFEFPPGNYSLLFRFQLGKTSKRFGRRGCNVDQVHGWDIKPVRFQLSTSNGQCALSECFLREQGNWVHYHVGDFVIDDSISNASMKIKFSMMQIDCTHTKGGLSLDSVLICPSEFRERSQRCY